MTGNGRADSFCWGSNGGVWSDSDRGQDYCRKSDNAIDIPNCDGRECFVASGETVTFGEYPASGGIECCGDDSNEYFVNTDCGGSTVTGKCCNNGGDVILDDGTCGTQSGCCPTNFHWDNIKGECEIDSGSVCEQKPPSSIICDVPSYQNGFCLFELPTPYDDSCCYYGSYDGDDFYTWQNVVVLTN